jgi:hypothetical protein
MTHSCQTIGRVNNSAIIWVKASPKKSWLFQKRLPDPHFFGKYKIMAVLEN